MGGPPLVTTSADEDAAPESFTEIAIPAKGTLLHGKYRVEGVLGIGGMGLVLAARHEVLKKRVALKMLLPAFARNPDVRARFEREAQAAFSLRSEHVCRVLDAGELENGQLFITMEYLKGEDLGSILAARGKLPAMEAVEYVLQACEGLAEAHESDVVHRDLKPTNLLVVQRKDGTPCVKIIDFGISKLSDDASGELTRTNAYMGSPLYSAPEQLASARAATTKSDLWSLGVILYELLTGVLPFPMSEDMNIFINAIRHNQPIALRAREPSLDPALESIVRRCLEKNPAMRYASASELAAALLPFAGSRPSLSSSSGGHPRFAATPADGVPGATFFDPDAGNADVRPFAPHVRSSDIAGLHAAARSARGEETGTISWLSVVTLIGAALMIAFIAWRSQYGKTPEPSSTDHALTAAATAPLDGAIEAAPSSSVVPAASWARPTRIPRGAASHGVRGAAPPKASATAEAPPSSVPITPMFRTTTP